jgi:oligopeptide/dipeptide ABC transporter ATP-binding protein
MVFQDPYSSLNPRMTIRQTLSAPLHLHKLCPASEVEGRIRALLGRVGLEPNAADRYPHAFSGGQRQRLCIARALVVEPRILVCDEPVSALDVSIRAQIINLLLRLKDELGLALLMISHDLGVVEHMSDRIAVMYLGRFVEEGRWDQVLSKPAHPYTRALLASVPGMHKTGAVRARMTGEAPSALRPPPGCAFHPRCPVAVDACRSGAGPGITGTAEGHQARCHLLQQGVTA